MMYLACLGLQVHQALKFQDHEVRMVLPAHLVQKVGRKKIFTSLDVVNILSFFVSGKNGKQGKSGTNGLNGRPGLAGVKGTQGLQG